jgi:hypothetical protein
MIKETAFFENANKKYSSKNNSVQCGKMKEEQDDKILDPEKVKTDSVIKD